MVFKDITFRSDLCTIRSVSLAVKAIVSYGSPMSVVYLQKNDTSVCIVNYYNWRKNSYVLSCE